MIEAIKADYQNSLVNGLDPQAALAKCAALLAFHKDDIVAPTLAFTICAALVQIGSEHQVMRH